MLRDELSTDETTVACIADEFRRALLYPDDAAFYVSSALNALAWRLVGQSEIRGAVSPQAAQALADTILDARRHLPEIAATDFELSVLDNGLAAAERLAWLFVRPAADRKAASLDALDLRAEARQGQMAAFNASLRLEHMQVLRRPETRPGEHQAAECRLKARIARNVGEIEALSHEIEARAWTRSAPAVSALLASLGGTTSHDG